MANTDSNRHWTTESVRSHIEKQGWRIASSHWKYINKNTTILLFCSNGHRCDKSFSRFQQGNRCQRCTVCIKLSESFVKDVINKEGWRIACDDWKYTGCQATIPLLCLNGHRSDKPFSRFQQGTRCAICRRSNFSIIKHSK